MKIGFFIFVLFLLVRTNSLGQVKSFNDNSDVLKLKKGDSVIIQVDSAYVLSGTRAEFLNARLDELDTIRNLYNNQVSNQKDLLDKIEELDGLILKFRSQAIQDSVLMSNRMSEVLSDLNTISRDLRENNEQLRANNEALELRIQYLNSIIKDLRKEIRGIWWNGVADKILAFGVGLGVGVVLTLVF